MKTFDLPSTSLFETFNCRYYEMRHEAYNEAVLAQVLKNDRSGLDDVVYLKNDYEINRSIAAEGSLKAYDMVLTPSGFVVIKEFFNGIPLSQFILHREFSVPLFLQIAMRLTRLLRELHLQKILVKEFVIEDILVVPETLEMKICSLGSATRVLRERPEYSPEFIHYGPLWHIAPEQTGRVGRTVDHRTDFYGLGVILYQVLCWRKPFNYTDSLELIHAHIAKRPLEPRQVREHIPQIISDIVMKLLAKNSEDRYQGADGILADLEHCMRQWQQTGTVSPFVLGAQDHSSQFSFSEKLYGRDEALGVLLAAWKRIDREGASLLLVAGYSGIGKTRLVSEIKKPVLEANAYFISGKFDQYAREYPYSAFVQAFSMFTQQILGEREEDLALWRTAIARQLGENGALLTGLVADLEKLLGPQGPIPDIGAMEGKNRFLNTCIDFLSSIALNGKSLVIFLDDLQWADSGSLALLQAIASSSLSHILVIGAYRDNEVDAAHPLSTAMAHLEKEHRDKVTRLSLPELDAASVNQLVADSLRMSEAATKALSAEIMARTRGNPFFVREFVEKLLEERAIQYDETLRSWVWDLESIRSMDLSGYVVDLILGKLRRLDPSVQDLVQLAACIGSRFDMDTLQQVAGIEGDACSGILQQLVAGEFISPVGSWGMFHNSSFLEGLSLSGSRPNFMFRFQHDRIQQASYDLITGTVRIQRHLRIGRRLLQQMQAAGNDEQLFDVLNHLNTSRGLIENLEERKAIARLNLKAGRRAMNNNAIQPALNYFEAGMELLSGDQASEAFKELLISRSECAYLYGNYQASEQWFDEALSDAETNIARADILARKMALYENTQRHELALEAAKQGLGLLGIRVPLNAGQLDVLRELLRVRWKLRGRTTRSLFENRDMEATDQRLAMKILMNMWGPCYLLQKQNLLAWKILRMVNLSVDHGNSIESAIAYAFYGYVTSAQFGDYEKGYAFAQLGIELNDKFRDKTLRSKILVIAEGCVAHWKRPFGSYLQNLREAHHVGIENNDIIYAGYAVTFVNRAQILMGEELGSAYEKLRGYIRFAQNIRSSISYHQMLAWARAVIILRGEEADEQVFGKFLSAQDHLAALQAMAASETLPLPLANYHTAMAMCEYLMGNFERAFRHACEAEPLMISVLGLPEWPEQKIWLALSASTCMMEGMVLDRKWQTARKKAIAMIARWATACPANYAAKHHLLLCEDHLLNGRRTDAIREAERSVRAAAESGMSYIGALAAERLARIHSLQNEPEKHAAQLRYALLEYDRWGARAKVEQLIQQHPLLGSGSSEISVSTPSMRGGSLDLKSIMQAAATLSEEVVFEKLIEKLLLLSIENAGAQNAWLLMNRREGLCVEASSAMANEFTCEIAPVPLEDVDDIAHSLVRKVRQTAEAVILDDARHDPIYAHDPQLKKAQARSVLCMPIFSKGQVSAILYMDNRSASNAFTPARLEVLRLLSAQMAVSLENALLYQQLEQKVEERTATIATQKAEIEREKQKADALLRNILPEEVAGELKENGFSRPRKYDEVTIMFTDFEGFTAMTEHMRPEEVVEIVDQHYKAFDRIIAEYGIEKIKTIGDAYMCVSGLPRGFSDHASRCIRAAREILNCVAKYNSERIRAGLPHCEVRIGIHTGPVVAGVVGLNKFAFDIWGDAVNTASRMETVGMPGQINVSRSTWMLTQDDFEFTYRGKVSMKHKGELDMYFVAGDRQATQQTNNS
ncbi:MAG: AAA family ATPase [Saprospiraceae bacterium]|nr:AAA family ATPase [Saprospiraceae bacterium]